MIKKADLLYSLKKGQHFHATELPSLGELVFTGKIEGTLAHVTATDPVIHRSQCSLYGPKAKTFCLRPWTEIVPAT